MLPARDLYRTVANDDGYAVLLCCPMLAVPNAQPANQANVSASLNTFNFCLTDLSFTMQCYLNVLLLYTGRLA